MFCVTISHMERVHGGTIGPAWHMYLGVAHTRSLLLLLRSIIFTKYNRLWLRLLPCIACGFVVVTIGTHHFAVNPRMLAGGHAKHLWGALTSLLCGCTSMSYSPTNHCRAVAPSFPN